jgi:hypothetical protein
MVTSIELMEWIVSFWLSIPTRDAILMMACGLALLSWVVFKLDEKYVEKARDDER